MLCADKYRNTSSRLTSPDITNCHGHTVFVIWTSSFEDNPVAPSSLQICVRQPVVSKALLRTVKRGFLCIFRNARELRKGTLMRCRSISEDLKLCCSFGLEISGMVSTSTQRSLCPRWKGLIFITQYLLTPEENSIWKQLRYWDTDNLFQDLQASN